MNIYPKIGIESVRLGMSKSQVRDMLGEPSRVEVREKNEIDDWEYDQGLELSFQKEDLYLLGTITTTNIAAQLDSKKIIGLDEQALLKSFPYLVLEDDFEESGKGYTCSEKELSVWVLDGLVTHVTIFPAYDQTGIIPIWPSNSA